MKMPNKKGSKQWLHPPEALLRGHILYTVKFLGECTVETPKGNEVVKDAIRKMKFNKHIKRAEGQKPPKVDLTVSSEAVKIADPKSRQILHQYPLHRISYCADDKSDKRMFTFIANDAHSDKHVCYVFDSEKCAEEITLTIGQAFDLAYKQFLETSNSDVDFKKQCLVLQKKVQTLQFENDELKKRVQQLEKLKDRSDLDEYMRNNQISDLTNVGLTLRESSTDDHSAPSQNRASVVGRRLEGLLLGDESSSTPEPHTNGKHHSNDSPTSSGQMPFLSPPPANTRQNRANARTTAPSSSSNITSPMSNNNPFTSQPPAQQNNTSINPFPDPFGMPAFSPTQKSPEQDIWDMRDGFSRGLSFGADDFNLDDLDPLNHK